MSRLPLVAAAALLASCNRATPPAPVDPFAAARAAVLDTLRDPDSARFAGLHAGKAGAVCGTVNARNGFGGMTGARPFAWSPAGAVHVYDIAGELGQWKERGEIARAFAALGCSIGPHQAKALTAIAELERHGV